MPCGMIRFICHGLQGIRWNVTLVFHGAVEPTVHFELYVVDWEVDDMSTFGGDAASGKEIGA